MEKLHEEDFYPFFHQTQLGDQIKVDKVRVGVGIVSNTYGKYEPCAGPRVLEDLPVGKGKC